MNFAQWILLTIERWIPIQNSLNVWFLNIQLCASKFTIHFASSLLQKYREKQKYIWCALAVGLYWISFSFWHCHKSFLHIWNERVSHIWLLQRISLEWIYLHENIFSKICNVIGRIIEIFCCALLITIHFIFIYFLSNIC